MKKIVLLLALAGSITPTAKPDQTDDPVVPGEGFPASRYEALWTKSPFAVATIEAVESPDYTLAGFAKLDGVSYVSLIEKQNQEHFLVSSDKPTRGFVLTSITQSRDGWETYVVIQKDGHPITLKLEGPPHTASPAAVTNAPPMPTFPAAAPQITMPGANLQNTGSTRPLIRRHRPLSHLPGRPEPEEEQQSSPQQQQPVQAHTPPPQ